MSSTLTETITDSLEAANFIHGILAAERDRLGLGFLGINERLTPEYPAVVVLSGSKEKQVHTTHVFLVMIEVIVMVYHARLDNSHSHRTEEDLELVENIENLLETGEMNFDGRVIFAFVQSSAPVTGTGRKNDAVVGTQMVVAIESRKGFPYGI